MVRYYGPQTRFDGGSWDDNPRLRDEISIFDDDERGALDHADDMGLDVSKDRSPGLEPRPHWRDEAYEDYYGLS